MMRRFSLSCDCQLLFYFVNLTNFKTIQLVGGLHPAYTSHFSFTIVRDKASYIIEYIRVHCFALI